MLTNAIQRFHLDATLWLLLKRALFHRSQRTGAIHNRLRSLNRTITDYLPDGIVL